MIADWKLEMMCKHLLEEIWTNRKEAIIEAENILKQCYKEEGSKQSDDVAVRRKIEKIKQKMDILIDMRTEGDISISDFRERKQKLELELQECENQLREQI